jgi:hypothetical protein
MAERLSEKEILSNPEFEALKDIEGIDPSKLMEQVTGVPGESEPGGDPPVGGNPPAEPSGTPPPAGNPPATPPADPVPGQRDDILKEIFGDRFKTVDEAKQANIASTLDEIESLRQAKIDLENRLSSKPKTNFANDEVALYNEFVKETGIKDYGVFSRVNSADVANMDPMEALVTKHVLDNPTLTGKEAQVRKYIEKKYNVDPDLVDEDELAINKIGMEADGASAKRSLQEIKEKLKVPEETQDPSTPKELTPEEKTTLQTGWGKIGESVSTAFGKLKIPIKNGKEPLLDYEISESEQKEISDFIQKYAVENQMELNENNIRMVNTMVYNQLMINKIPDIVHSVFEKARSLTEEQVHSLYENPSPARNNDQPPVPPTPQITEEEQKEEAIFNAEMERYNQ